VTSDAALGFVGEQDEQVAKCGFDWADEGEEPAEDDDPEGVASWRTW